IVNPMNIFLPSFQMSFSAVLGLISFNINKKYIGVFFSSFIATVFSLPFVAYNFNYCSISGILANFIAIPLVTILILPLSLLWLVVINIPYSVFISKILEFLIHTCLFNIADIFSKFASLHFINMPNITLFIFTISIVILGFLRSRLRYLGIVIAVINSIFWYNYRLPDIFISDKNIAIKIDKQLYFTSKRNSRLKRSWLNAIGADENKIILMKNSPDIFFKENKYNKNKFISFAQNNIQYKISFNPWDGYIIYNNTLKINFNKEKMLSSCFVWLDDESYYCNKSFVLKKLF
ncbi:MAG: ComEC/Rec2 family competence protein, partial [Anaplasmataceae bacterium]|nr:ComEC/Rec2 family competence protein [Anaplasmataceae bacterium]